MSQLTRKAIIDSTLNLASKRPLNKIKVRDIVNDCGITRNTFYYYFKDIYDVLDTTFCEEISKVAEDGKWHDATFFNLAEFVLKHKAAFRNVYNTMGDKKMRPYLYEKLHDIVMSYIRGEAEGIDADERDLTVISVFYEEAIGGLLLRWLRGDMPKNINDDFIEMTEKIRIIFTGHIRKAVENSVNLRKNK